jgi:uncharacterized protein YdeI (YjbR/CyaY-like superfamily)
MQTQDVDAYLAEGCGRCDQFKTPSCKVHRWQAELVALRSLVLATGLHEQVKWGCPCYDLDGTNVAMISAYREFACISFFNGALLVDDSGRLESPGPNSQAARLLKFTSVDEIRRRRANTGALLDQAMALARKGARVQFSRTPEPMPEELRAVLDGNPGARTAFDALTPGRQRSHILQVAGAKQSATRRARAERCVPKILAGKGFLDR